MFFYSRSERFIALGQKKIQAKCPDCGNTDVLTLYFYQKEITTGTSIIMTNKVTGTLYCSHTNTEIPPIQWSDRIVANFETEKSRLKLLPKGWKLNKKSIKLFFYILIPIFIIAGSAIFLIATNADELIDFNSEYSNAEVNDKLKVEVATFQNDSRMEVTYFNINKIDGDTVYVQKHRDIIEKIDTLNLKSKDFTGQIFKIRYDSFREGFLTEWNASDTPLAGFTKKLIKTED